MSKLKIEDIDPNFAVPSAIEAEGLVWQDARQEPFDLYGFCSALDGEGFRRVPQDVAEATSPGVANLALHTSGGRLRLTTDSPYIAILAEFSAVTRFSHMPLTGTAGFDLYEDGPHASRWIHTFMPPEDLRERYESIHCFPDRRTRSLTLNFPLYSAVKKLYIGLAAGSSVSAGQAYAQELPVVYYGSSITQGGCASRPGNSYSNLISQRWNLDQINLGFSGSAKGETAITEYIASLDFAALVLDYDHNAPDTGHLEATHETVFRTVRGKHPDTPILIVSKPDFDTAPAINSKRREIVYETYRRAVGRGDRRVRFLDGESLFGQEFRDACTVDGVHPNDAGFVRMAAAIGRAVTEMLDAGNG